MKASLKKRFDIIWAALRLGMSVPQYKKRVRFLTSLKQIGDQVINLIPKWDGSFPWSETLSEVRYHQQWVSYLTKYNKGADLVDWISRQEAHWLRCLEIHQGHWTSQSLKRYIRSRR